MAFQPFEVDNSEQLVGSSFLGNAINCIPKKLQANS